MTTPSPTVTVIYLDTAGNTQVFNGPADAVQIFKAGMGYVDPNDPTGTQNMFPWHRILQVSTPGTSLNFGTP